MEINGKKVGFYYSIGADADIDDELQKIAVNDFVAMIDRLGAGPAYAKLATVLNKWYCMKNGGEPLGEKDFLMLPAGQIDELQNEVLRAMKEGRKMQIKAKPVKGKNAESAGQSD